MWWSMFLCIQNGIHYTGHRLQVSITLAPSASSRAASKPPASSDLLLSTNVYTALMDAMGVESSLSFSTFDFFFGVK